MSRASKVEDKDEKSFHKKLQFVTFLLKTSHHPSSPGQHSSSKIILNTFFFQENSENFVQDVF